MRVQENLQTPKEGANPVAADAAEGLLTSIRIGDRIKKLRLKRSMGLVELSKRAGLSASFLSQLETGRVVPTLRNLSRIGLVFGKDLSYFFESTGKSTQHIFRIQKKAARVRLPVGSPSVDYIAESFGILIPEGGMRPCMAEFLPGEERNAFQPEPYPGVEMLYVLSGALDVILRDKTHTLLPRDVCYLSGETSRRYRCAGHEAAQALIISFDAEHGVFRHKKVHLP